VEGDTSTFECAHQLGNLCANRHLVVNLIPYNQTDVKTQLSCPSEEHIKEFQNIVSKYGVFCSVRRTMGADIAGACGQLLIEDSKSQIENDIEDGLENKVHRSFLPNKKRKQRGNAPDREQTEGENDLFFKSCGQKADIITFEKINLVSLLYVATAISAAISMISGTLFLSQRKR